VSETVADLFKRISVGVYVVGVVGDERSNAFTAAWVTPVSFDPLLLALSINPQHASYGLLRTGRVFSINVLSKDQLALAEHFGCPGRSDKLATVAWQRGKTGAPLLDDVVAHFECETAAEYPAGDHVLILGKVVAGCLLRADLEPLLYSDTGDMDGSAAIFPDCF